MVARASVCLRRLGGRRSQEVRFGRFLSNDKVTLDRLIEGWSEQTGAAVAGRHILAIQDTTELNFRTTLERRRGLGEIGKGVGRGALAHVMLAVDANNGSCLGLVAGKIWSRPGRIAVSREKRLLAQKESERWLTTASSSKQVLAAATTVTVVADRESDIYAEWARLPGPGFELLTRVMHDRRLADGRNLFTAGMGLPGAGVATIELPARGPNRQQRRLAELSLRFGPVVVRRPKNSIEPGLPENIQLTLVEVVELHPPQGAEPVHWRLLTTHEVPDAAAAWRIVGWYKARWAIEQLFRVLKLQGLRLEASQLDDADRLLKLAAIAIKAAAITLQLVHARDAHNDQPASLVFADPEIDVLHALNASLEGKTRLQKNPHANHDLAWASWIIARLGGWDGYPSSKPPGPITFKHGLEYFRSIVTGWNLKHVCMP